jgi:hypothetical protein
MYPVLYFADKFGISNQLLRHYLKKPDAPKAALYMKGKKIVRKYDLHEMEIWWKALNDRS